MNAETENRIAELGQIALGTAILFISIPAYVLGGNADEILAADRYFLNFAAIGLGVLAVGWLLTRYAGGRVAAVAASLFAGYAISAYIADLLFPLDIGAMETGDEVAPFQPLGSAVQLVLFAAATILLLKAPARFTGRISWIAAAVLVASAALHMGGAIWSGDRRTQAEAPQDPATSDGFNIYHVVFDAYHGPWLQFAMQELDLPQETFSDFKHYKAARSNYWQTRVSFPSFLSGTMYRRELTIRDWRAEAEAGSLIGDLKHQGYGPTVYALLPRDGFRSVDRFFSTAGPAFPLVLDYWTLRAAPIALRPVALTRGRGLFSRVSGWWSETPTGDTRGYDSYRLFEQALADEAQRPDHGQYVLFHSYIPHTPYQMDRHGNFGKSSYNEQLLLATQMMDRLASRLKKLGRYERSLIIFHSDHGSGARGLSKYTGDPLRDFITVDEETSEAIRLIDTHGSSGRDIDARYSALLLIKPPLRCVGGDSAEMDVDKGLVQLLDLRSYLQAAVSDPESSCEYPRAEYVDMHHGMSTQKQGDKFLNVGTDLLSGSVNHYRITSDFKWQILDNIPFRYK
jgi:hypothetical protein